LISVNAAHIGANKAQIEENARRLDEITNHSVLVEGVPPDLRSAIGTAVTDALRGDAAAVEGSLKVSMADNALFSLLSPGEQERSHEGATIQTLFPHLIR
jgi:hypothetical protein